MVGGQRINRIGSHLHRADSVLNLNGEPAQCPEIEQGIRGENGVLMVKCYSLSLHHVTNTGNGVTEPEQSAGSIEQPATVTISFWITSEEGNRRRKALLGRYPCVFLPGTLPRANQPLDGPPISRFLKMVGNCIRIRRAGSNQLVGHTPVQTSPSGRQNSTVKCLSDERVGETHMRTVTSYVEEPCLRSS